METLTYLAPPPSKLAAKPRSTAGQDLLQFLIEHNPFYLLSAGCMLLGCLVLANTMSFSPVRASKLLALIVTLNVYEAVLIALGLLLIVRRNLVRDGRMLLVLETFFLVDVTFLGNEIATTDPWFGSIVNLVCLALAVVKVLVIVRVLRMEISLGLIGFIVLQLGFLYFLPGFFAQAEHGSRMSRAEIYAAWWVLGGMVALLPFIVSPTDLRASRRSRAGEQALVALAVALIVVPFVSLMAHLCTANWVFKVRYYIGNISPLLLGLAVLCGRYCAMLRSRQASLNLQTILPALAIAFSMYSPVDLRIDFGAGPSALAITPLRIVLLGAAAAYAHGFAVHRIGALAWAAVLCVLAALLGPSVSEIFSRMRRIGTNGAEIAKAVGPASGTDWGVLAVILSFVLLGIGAAFSFMKRPSPQAVQPVEEPLESSE